MDLAEYGSLNAAGRLETRCLVCGGRVEIEQDARGTVRAACYGCKAMVEVEPLLEKMREESDGGHDDSGRGVPSSRTDGGLADEPLALKNLSTPKEHGTAAEPLRGHGAARQADRDIGDETQLVDYSNLPADRELLARVPPHNLEAEQSVLGAILIDNQRLAEVSGWLKGDQFYQERHRTIYGAMVTLNLREDPIDAVTLGHALTATRDLERIGGVAYIAELASVTPTPSAIRYYAEIVRDMAIKRDIHSQLMRLANMAMNGVSVPGLRGESERVLRPFMEADDDDRAGSLIVSENFDHAVSANDEYLKRREIIERLAYSQSISLTVGGKHHGKTTIQRTKALSIVRGMDFLGRATTQGPVIYAASDDELASTRMELLRMGWNARTDPLTLVHIRPDVVAEPDRIIDQIAKLAIRSGAIYIVLDMLFDFAGIKDEMGYAHTREAIGKIQRLADITLAHVDSTHHSPKYMLDTANAATAALGSQGIAARFSPIMLTRKWADGLYTVESTMTRDPRGLGIPQTCIEVDEFGWARPTGPFKNWMKWKIFAPRVLGLMEGDEPGKEYSVDAVARALDIGRPDAQNTLYRLFKDRKLERDKKGRGFRYWVPFEGKQLLETTDEAFENKHGGESHE